MPIRAEAALDWNRPYAEIHGEGRILIEQDGQQFTRTGVPVATDGSDTLITRTDVAVDPQPSSAIVTALGEPAKVSPDDMRLKENRALKAQMENYGQDWQGVEHARTYLGIS